MAKKSRVLIVTPGLTYLGGTELETLITAKMFLESNTAEEIVMFSPVKASNSIIEYYNEKRIIYWNYPSFYSFSFVQRIDSKIKKIMKIFKWNFSPLQFTYWWTVKFFYKFRFNYVITDSAQFYYAPGLINFKLDKTIIKFTNCFLHTQWNNFQKALLGRCKVIIVTAENQKTFLSNKFQPRNIDVVDVFTWNENRLLKIKATETKKYTFGMLCRISNQKQIQDGIILVKKLKDFGIITNLLIKGPSKDRDYLEYLKQLIIELGVESNITIDTMPLKPQKIPSFFKKINIFLITSNYEGGPNTGLESMAAGVPVLSYNIGAMHERLAPYIDLLIAKDMENLLEKSIFLINMKKETFNKLSLELRNYYLLNYSNQSILASTLKYIDNK